MLKWLVQRVPQPHHEEPRGATTAITDDPLATLEFENIIDQRKRKRKNKKEIYSVNRTNPLYSNDESNNKVSSPNFSSSSGYASNGNNNNGDKSDAYFAGECY